MTTLAEPVDIAMVVCNRTRITATSICQLKVRTTTEHRLIVLDNGSNLETKKALSYAYENNMIDILIRAPRNLGIHWAHNTLLDHVLSKPYYVSMDNDIIPPMPTVDGDWLQRLIALADEWTGFAAIAMRPHVMIGDSPKIWDDAPEVLERPWVGAHGRLMVTDITRQVGWNRKKLDPKRNNEERFVCGRLQKLGYKTGYARDIQCIHLFGEPKLNEDSWGYSSTLSPEEHGHHEIWPPPHHYAWHRTGVDWETCKVIT